MRLVIALVGAAVQLVGGETEIFKVPPTDGLFFAETFENGLTWIKTSQPDYLGQPVEVSPDESLKAPMNKDHGLVLLEDAKRYGLAGEFKKPLIVDGKPFVLQYEVKLTKGLSCGGAYLKLLQTGVDLKSFGDKSPFTIMFGPDACGDTNKVHFIMQHQSPKTKAWEEKHATSTPAPLKDTSSHLYTLVVKPDQSYEIFIDLESKSKGSLLKDMSPSVEPPIEIDDPTDSKPSDWEDQAKIKDPAASKPSDWDESAPRKIPDEKASKPSDWFEDEPLEIPDPKAVMPEDWDVDEDGDWEAPLVSNPKCTKASGCGPWKRPEIDNPNYKGKWTAPLIDNPKYKGVWKARQIPNPNYFEDKNPAKLAPMSAVAIEVWTMSGGIRIDNVIICDDLSTATEFAKNSWALKANMEKREKRQKSKEEVVF